MMFDTQAYHGQQSLPLSQFGQQGFFNPTLGAYQIPGQMFPSQSQFPGQLGGGLNLGPGLSMLSPAAAGLAAPYAPFGGPSVPWMQPNTPIAGWPGTFPLGALPFGALQAQCAQAFGAQNPMQQALPFGIQSPIQHALPFGIQNPMQHALPFGIQNPIQHALQLGLQNPFQHTLQLGLQNPFPHTLQPPGLQNPWQHALQLGSQNPLQQALPFGGQTGLPFGGFGLQSQYGLPGQQGPYGGWPGQAIACLTPQGLVTIVPQQASPLFGAQGSWPFQQQLGRILPYQLTPQMASATA